MKNIIIILLAIFPLLGYSQIDSAALKINVTIQARDAEYIGSQIAFKEPFEDLFDNSKVKFRVTTPPTNNTTLSIDNVSVGEWLLVATHLRKDYIALQAGIFTRLDAILRAKNNAYLTRMLNDNLTFDTRLYYETRESGRKKLTRQ